MPGADRRWWVCGALMVSVLLVGLDTTVLNVALPTLAADLRASTEQLQWIVASFILAVCGLMLPAGALADRIGRKRTLLTGIVVFSVGSLASAFAGSADVLIATRALMGVGAAVITTVPFAVITTLFDDDERPRAIAAFAVAMGLGFPLGPIVGGWLLEHFWWGSVFLINLPLGLVAALAVAALLPDAQERDVRGADLVGAVLSTAGLVALVYAVVEVPARGWTSGVVGAAGALGLLLVGLFGWWERRCDQPMVDLSLLARRRFRWGITCATVAMFSMLGLLFVLPLYLQTVRGHGPLETGLRLLPMILGLTVGAKSGERLARRRGGRLPVVAGLGLILAGLLWGSAVTAGTGYPEMAGWMVLIGIGMGMTTTPALDAALGEIPAERAGSGSSLTMALRKIGGAFGVAVLGSVLNAAYTARLDVTGLPPELARTARESVAAALALARRTADPALAASAVHAYVGAMRAVMLTTAGIVAVTLIVAAIRLPAGRGTAGRPGHPAEREGVDAAL